MNSSQQGIHFERWITRLYDQLGKMNVKHDVTLKRRTRQGKTRSQFDVTYGIIDKRYVECKYHANGDEVTFEDVSTFGAKLTLNSIAFTQGIMVTNTDYETRAKAYAQKVGITLIDREKLIKLDWKRTHQLRSIAQAPPEDFGRTLEQRIKAYKP